MICLAEYSIQCGESGMWVNFWTGFMLLWGKTQNQIFIDKWSWVFFRDLAIVAFAFPIEKSSKLQFSTVNSHMCNKNWKQTPFSELWSSTSIGSKTVKKWNLRCYIFVMQVYIFWSCFPSTYWLLEYELLTLLELWLPMDASHHVYPSFKSVVLVL